MEDEVQKAKNGDKNSFEIIIKLMEKKLYLIAKSRLKKEEDICDAVQETILQVYKELKKLKHIEKFEAWMIKILINNCNSIINSKYKYNIYYEDTEYENYLITDNDYDNVNADISFSNLISILDLDEKTIVILYYYNKYTTKQISEILNINESTIRSKIMRAKKKIIITYKGGI